MLWIVLFQYCQFFTSVLQVIIKEATLEEQVLLRSSEYKNLADKNFMYSLKAY